MFEIIMYKYFIQKLARSYYLLYFILKISFVVMLSVITNQENVPNKLIDYESIFKHYGFETQSQQRILHGNERSIEINDKNLFKTNRSCLERNESNKKTINAKTITKKAKQTTAKKDKKSEKKVCFKR